MSGLHHLQTSPSAPRADLFKSATVPAGNPWADAAAALLRHRFEALASQLAELEALRERVLEAEQKLDPSFV
ncbi:hypothetical protein [Bradyrhizobium sp. WSM1743]|uniref:hypothetical protein n=1 Tax=Bradyrhizobium sp. WSM1743 TaxID=318996 RepID=UPI0012EBE62D|nr:hypothetical protein [Bradyrhizobium sp. WSM1743]